MKEAGAWSFFILTLILSLMFGGILNANTTIGIEAFAKKSSKKIFDRSSSDGNGRTSGSRGKDSSLDSGDTSFNEDTKSTEPFVPLPLSSSAETPANSKYVIINFDDSQSDYTYAKPILDKYGFKATFFEVCNWIEAGYHDKDISVTWQQIAALQQDGMDIEAL
jgi:Polysaccharide deacetylase